MDGPAGVFDGPILQGAPCFEMEWQNSLEIWQRPGYVAVWTASLADNVAGDLGYNNPCPPALGCSPDFSPAKYSFRANQLPSYRGPWFWHDSGRSPFQDIETSL